MSKNEELIRAAELLKENCKTHEVCDKEVCVFHNGSCCSLRNNPSCWRITKPPRWTPKDVALAKALKSFGAKTAFRPTDTKYPRWKSEDDGGWLPVGAFDSLKDGEIITLDKIIEEGENHG